jgi:hypothetical protein
MVKFLHNLGLLRVKNAYFFLFVFGENIFKNYSIGPWRRSLVTTPLRVGRGCSFMVMRSNPAQEVE